MKRICCRSSQAAKAVNRRLEFFTSLSLLVTAFMLLAAMRCHAAEATVFPGAKWAEATTESQGVDSAKLNEAAESLARTVGADGARELVVIPEWEMVVVRLGLDGKANDEAWNGFLAKVADSLKGRVQP